MTCLRYLMLIGIGALFAICGFGFRQEVSPGRSPQATLEMPGSIQQQAIRVQVRFVPVNVIVTDANGRPVTDLKQEDFQIFENGKPQEIRHFILQKLDAAAPEPGQRPVQPLDRGRGFAPQSARTFLLLMGYGRIQLPFNSVDALIRFVREELLPQDSVALFAYNRATEFTTDHEKIARALERFKKEHEWVTALMDQRMSGLAAIYGSREMPKECQEHIDKIFVDPEGLASRNLDRTQMADKGKMTREADRVTETLQRKAAYDDAVAAGDPAAALRLAMMQFDTLAAQAITDLPFSEYAADFGSTMDDLQNIYTGIDYLRHMDGEKHLVFFTPSGIFLPRAEYDGNIIAFANDARVAIDTFQTGGLSVDPGWETRASIQSLRNISDLTGGQASIYQRVEKTLARLDESTRVQYLLGYYPKDENWDGKYRRIEVKINRPGLKLSFRHGYYARDTIPALDAAELLSYRRITAAGSRLAEINDLPFQARPVVDDLPGSPEIKVDLSVAPQDIDLTVINGVHTGELRVAIFYADKAGNYLGDVWKTVTLKLREESYQKYLQAGIPFTISVPSKVPNQILKVVIYDVGNDRLGSKLIRMQ